jgi:SOS-response transcriptional repressor LexA
MSAAAKRAEALSARQLEVLSYLYGHARDRGYQPDLAEIAAGTGQGGLFTARNQLAALEKKGYVRVRGRFRSVEMLIRPDGKKFEGFADKT